MEDYFKTQSIHCQGKSSLDIDHEGNLYTVGSDDILFVRNLPNNTRSAIDINPSAKPSYTCLTIDPTQPSTVFLGRPNSIHKFTNANGNQTQQILSLSGQINSLSCWKHLLAIGSQDSYPLIMNQETKKTVKCRPGHSSAVLNVQFSPNGNYLCSTSSDGTLKIYKFDAKLDPQLIFTHIFSTETVLHPMCPSINETSSAIAVPGRPFLQLLQHQQLAFRQQSIDKVKHEANITICHWQSLNILVTGGQDNQLVLWNMVKKEKITKIPTCSLHSIKKYGDTFYGLDSLGTLYQFIRLELLTIKVQKVQEEVEPVEEVQEEREDIKQVVFQQPKVVKKQLLPHVQLVSCIPQDVVSGSCQKSKSTRFLTYNHLGCVYELPSTNWPIVQIEFHDKSVIFSKQDGLRGKAVKAVSLGNCQVAYATDTEVGYIGQTTWSMETDIFIDVALGNSWIAALSEDDIYVFDFAGNCIRRISVDRQYVSIRAYENLLVLLYHDSIPMEGNQSLRMRVYLVNDSSDSIGLQQEMTVPISHGSILQHFMFSSRGMLISQDSHNKIRTYDMLRRQWLTVYDMNAYPQEATQNMWLIDIANDNIIAFLLPQGQTEPSVLPRSVPRTIRIDPPTLHMNTSYADRYAMLLWQTAKISHQKFRSRQWYMYKYSRKKQHLLYGQSQSIMSDDQIRERQAKIQLEAVEIVKLMVQAHQAKKALSFCKSFIKHSKDAALEVFDESEGCGAIAGKLREFYKEKQIEKKLHRRVQTGPILLSIEKQILAKIAGLNIPEWTCRDDRPYKLPMTNIQRSQKLQNEFRKLAD